MNSINETDYPQLNPSLEDKFTRRQILDYLEEIPLGYLTEREHEATEHLITRVQCHFAKLSTDWKPSND
jgi:hypothetical protein